MKSRSRRSNTTTSHGLALSEARLGRLVAAGNSREALRLASEVRRANPKSLAALRICAQAAVQNRDYAEAVQLYDDWTSLAAQSVEPLLGGAQAYINMGDLARALPLLNRALDISPNDPNACGYLSSVYFRFGDFAKALEYADRSIAGDATNPSAHNARGGSLLKLERYEEALMSLVRAIELFPGEYYADAVENLALTFHDMRRFEEAYACYEQIYSVNPDDSGSLALFLHSALQTCNWSRIEELVASLRRMICDGEIPGTAPFIFLSMPGLTGQDHRRIASKSVEVMLAEQPSEPIDRISVARREGKLRIGYLSADFHDHATTHLLAEVLELHDRGRFELYAYSYGPDDGSPMRRRVSACFDAFRDFRTSSYVDAAETIRSDAIDILVDLKGWTHDARLEISALRPAPVIVSWLGYPGTLGHAGLADYILGDPIVTPFTHAPHYTEAIVQMPHTYQPNDRKRSVGRVPTREEEGLPEGATVFCNFNQAYKFSPGMFSAWCEILNGVAGSVLWLLEPTTATAKNLRDEASRRGIDPERIVFARRLPLPLHLGRLQLASLALDTFPYTSHTTCSDALWAGVPLVTVMGETFASRVAASLVTAAGLPELVTHSFDEFVERAISLASNHQELGRLRLKLSEGRGVCALFDAPRFTRNLERAYESIVENSARGVVEPVVVSEGPR